MKKIVGLALAFIITLSSIGCSNSKTDMTNVEKDNGQKEITILIKDYDCDNFATFAILKNYGQRYEYEKGIKVNFDIITASNEEDYQKKSNAKLYLEDGPTLIFISAYDSYQNYITQGVALDTKNNIPNLDKVYDSLLNDEYDGHYFMPVSMEHFQIALNRPVIERLGIDPPELDWTRDEYLKIKEKALSQEPEYFTSTEYWELIIPKIDKILEKSDNNFDLNNNDNIRFINDVREEIFSGKYILNKDYSFENYCNMIFVRESKEYEESQYLDKYYSYEKLRNVYSGGNGLRSLDEEIKFEINSKIILPNIIYGNDDTLTVWGLMVNNNGKNKELGMDFINGLLSDEVQLEIFNAKHNYTYPVNKEIEDDISKIEEEKNINKDAVALRKYILEQIENGNFRRNSMNNIKQKIQGMLYEDFAKFIFADEPYTDEELSQELQKFEDKYNMWLRE